MLVQSESLLSPRTFGLLLGLAAIVGSGCALSPTDGDALPNREASVRIEAFAANPGATVRIEASDGGAWAVFDTLIAGESPAVFDANLYPVDGYTVVPLTYWETLVPGFGAVATIRFIEVATPGGNQTLNPLRTFDEDGFTCLSDEFPSGVLYAGYSCSTGTTITLNAP